MGALDALADLGALPLELLAKSSLVLVAAAVTALVLRRASASARHAAWATAMLGLLGLPLVGGLLPRVELDLLPAGSARVAEDGSVATVARPRDEAARASQEPRVEADRVHPTGANGFGPAALAGHARRSARSAAGVASTTAPATTRPEPAATVERAALRETAGTAANSGPDTAASMDALTVLVLLWSAGAAWLAARAVLGLLAGRRLIQAARSGGHPLPAAELSDAAKRVGLVRPVEAWLSPDVDMPMAAGVLGTVVLLPVEADGWTATRRRSVLLHELAHVTRRDCVTQWLARLALALHWLNPLAWYAARRMVVERERACDDLVLSAGVGAEDYAECLLHVARTGRHVASLPAGVASMARRSQLEARLLCILDEARAPGAPSTGALRGAVAAVLLVLLPLGCVSLSTAEVASSEPPSVADAVPSVAVDGADEPAPGASDVVLRVAADGSGDHLTIQAALDVAAPGALIDVAPGEYVESLRVDRAVRLRGAGADVTLVRAASDAAPALRITHARDVAVSGLRFTSPGDHMPGAIMAGACVLVQGAGARLVDCAVTAAPNSGVQIEGAADVELRGSLVAATRANGIIVRGPAVARIVDCDVRDIHHYGVQVGQGADVTVERCRISGAGWHGIRYDASSPTVRDNLIFANERTGIYASGPTAARVTGNVFHANGYVGMSCWFGSSDRIEGNTFRDNGRSGLEIKGESAPQVVRNVFVGNGQGVATSNVTVESPYVGRPDGVIFEQNLFWDNDTHVRFTRFVDGQETFRPEDDLAFLEARDNVIEDPRLDPGEGQHGLAPDSSAVARGQGVARPISATSPWAIQPEEQPMRAERMAAAAEASALAAAPSRAAAYERARPWIEDALQIGDAERKARALDAIREALAADDEAERMAGLTGFLGAVEAITDKTGFRELILPCLDSEHGSVQRQAFYALYNVGPQEGDLERLLLVAHSNPPGFRDSTSHLIQLFSDGHIEGAASDVLVGLFQTDDPDELGELLGGLWGARVSADLEQRLLEIAQTNDRELYHDVIYFALSTLQGKSPAVLAELFRAAQHPDHNNSGRALWGLGFGVEPGQSDLVADFAVDYFGARGTASARSDALDLLEEYAGPAQLSDLRAMAANDLLSERERERLREIVGRIPEGDG